MFLIVFYADILFSLDKYSIVIIILKLKVFVLFLIIFSSIAIMQGYISK